MDMSVELAKKYLEEVVPALMKEFNYSNIMEVPKIKKIVVNIGVGDAKENRKLIEASSKELGAITGQKPVVTKAKNSLSNFKIREGMPIGVKVTLRGERMYHFMAKLINASLPRVRDFQGLSRKGFDGRGNYNLGVKEQLIFPEVNYDEIERVRGMNITFVTTSKTNEESLSLLENMGMPFVKARSK
jgi:large subunit ribosomal protein L5